MHFTVLLYSALFISGHNSHKQRQIGLAIIYAPEEARIKLDLLNLHDCTGVVGNYHCCGSSACAFLVNVYLRLLEDFRNKHIAVVALAEACKVGIVGVKDKLCAKLLNAVVEVDFRLN